jgi:hypothetical protein
LDFFDNRFLLILLYASVAKGPTFLPQNAKGAEKNSVGPGKSGAELLADLPGIKKGPKRGRTAEFV